MILTIVGCLSENNNSKYHRWVGDSKINLEIDDANFNLCHGESRVKQYFNFSQGLQYEGEKNELFRHFKQKYNPINSTQSGWVRIRFIVNCKGETGRFRIISSDENYKEQDFEKEIINQLLEMTKALNGWEILPELDKSEDYYQYIIFKIHQGDIIEILP